MRPDARPLSREADEWREPEPAEPDDEPGLSRPGLWKGAPKRLTGVRGEVFRQKFRLVGNPLSV